MYGLGSLSTKFNLFYGALQSYTRTLSYWYAYLTHLQTLQLVLSSSFSPKHGLQKLLECIYLNFANAHV
jgi:hypothetical protein